MWTMAETVFSRILLTSSKLPRTVGHQLHARSRYVTCISFVTCQCIMLLIHQNEQEMSWFHSVTLYE